MKKAIKKAMTAVGMSMAMIGGCGLDSNIALSVELIAIGMLFTWLGLTGAKKYAAG